jgi:hypothetical protein
MVDREIWVINLEGELPTIIQFPFRHENVFGNAQYDIFFVQTDSCKSRVFLMVRKWISIFKSHKFIKIKRILKILHDILHYFRSR